jgi:NAD(P)-dependent dehydrogenase (short-subunit alcohol dehydrogenase family)
VYAGVRGDAPGLDGADVRVVELDVTDPDIVAAAAKQISQEVGSRGLGAVVNNAGVIVQGLRGSVVRCWTVGLKSTNLV